MTKTSSLALLIFLCLFCLVAPLRLFAAGQSSAKPKAKAKTDYALIYGTVFGPRDAPAQGVRVLIRRSDAKKPKYERISDSQGEFAQRVPIGPADYLIYADPKAPPFGKHSKMKPGKPLAVHIAGNERQDISLHLAE
ncbi:MAG: carboxypeptidase-like regulatory domain-containing protein [Acidobacteriaceae bacterium]